MSEQLYQLVMRKGPKPGQVYPLFGDVLTIGREPASDISLNDPEVSRQHARLLRTESGYVLEDLGSTNGTYVDGVQLSNDTIELEPGQVIDLGSGVTLVYEAVGAADDAPDTWPEDDSDDALYQEPDTFDYDQPAPPPKQAAGYAPPPSQPPLVPSGESEQQKRRRRNIIIAVTAVVLLCCCCLAFFLSGWFWWGDPLMELLGFYLP